MLLISYLLSSFSIDYTKLREVSVPQQVLVLQCLDDILNTNHHVPPVLRISTLILAKAKTAKFIKFEITLVLSSQLFYCRLVACLVNLYHYYHYSFQG